MKTSKAKILGELGRISQQMIPTSIDDEGNVVAIHTADVLALVIGDNFFTYDIATLRFSTPEKRLGWVNHLSRKSWVNRHHIQSITNHYERVVGGYYEYYTLG